jgi:hypothetical protein
MDVSFTRHQDSLQQMSVQVAKFTKFGMRLLEESIIFSQQRHVYVSSPTSGFITTLQDKKYVVGLVKNFCACGRFQENCVPPGHAAALIRKLKYQPREYMAAVFSLGNYKKTYSRNINPVNTADLSVSADYYAPQLKRPRGRPKERRMRKGDRVKKRVGQQAAGQLPDVADRAPQRCSQCNQVGHNRTTCGQHTPFPFQ